VWLETFKVSVITKA